MLEKRDKLEQFDLLRSKEIVNDDIARVQQLHNPDDIYVVIDMVSQRQHSS